MLVRLWDHFEEGFIAFLLVAMTLLVFTEVILRFVFNTGFLWMEELTLHLSAWMVLFGASYGVKIGSHIGVDAVVRLLPSKARRVVGVIAVVLCLIYCALFLIGSWGYLAKLVKIGIEMEDLPVKKYLAHSILLIGFVMLAVRFSEVGWNIIQGKSEGFRHADEAKEALKELEKERQQRGEAEA